MASANAARRCSFWHQGTLDVCGRGTLKYPDGEKRGDLGEYRAVTTNE